MKFVVLLAVLALACFTIRWIWRGLWDRASARKMGFLWMCLGLFVPWFFGSVLKVTLPGGLSFALGGAIGAASGWVLFLFLGTLGLVGGGIAIAVTGWVFAGVGATFGVLGALGGFSIARVWVVSPLFWIPMIAFGWLLVAYSLSKPKTKGLADITNNPPSER
ncbi:hypothetical protein [Pseudacidovorax intermedius]|uniref:hypothetical protein n=1 Tax=Pseudacidovorax intermedius TaxID=433924 RepID=UPI0026EAA872|nr:hypothetical protein [Pseudacidovorax intermedius]